MIGWHRVISQNPMVIVSVVGLSATKQKEKNNMLNEQNRAESFCKLLLKKLGREVTYTPKPQDPLLII